MNIFIEKIKGLWLYIIGFVFVSALVFYPELSGKELDAHDSVQFVAGGKEYRDYEEKGESIKWTNRIFSGMPLYTFAGDYSGNFLGNYFAKLVLSSSKNRNIKILSIVFICGFLGLILLGVERKLSYILSLALGLNTWLLDSLWALHPAKILSYGFLFLAISGYISYMKYKRIGGLIALVIGLSLSVASSHYQIIYYGVIIFLIIAIYYLYIAVMIEKHPLDYIKSSAIILALVTLAGISNFSALMVVQDYNKETMRGGKTELIKPEANSTSKDGGLDINYAFSWSYSLPELLNFLVPDAMGGSSNYQLKPSKSKIAELFHPNEEENKSTPVYWGIQPFAGAPNYLGAGIVFLFIFSMFYWQNRLKYIFLGLFTLSILMGLGKSFLGFNELLFDYLPLYNKFRTPTMSFSILNMISILTIGCALKSFFSNELGNQRLIQVLKYSAYTFLGLMIVGFVLVSNEGYTSISDSQMFGNNQQALNIAIEERASLLKSDWMRSLIIVGLIVFLFYLYIKSSIKHNILILSLGIIIFLDLFFVSKRYLSYEVFKKAERTEELIPNNSYNQVLEQDKSYFRMINFAGSVFNDNTDGYRFSNVGGYSPAKLYRYQDLIDIHLSKGNQSVLNMLNTKYIVMDNQGQQLPQQNPNACGNAWFVSNVKFAKNANEEMDSIGTFDPKLTAWVDQRYKSETNFNGNTDENAKIELTKYHPENMEYTSRSNSGGFAVFSEIWYKGNEDWNLYIDGKLQKLIRTNYLLRGAYIPAGNHKIEMKFTAKKLDTYILISRIATSLIVLTVLGLLFNYYKRNASKG